MDSGVLLDYNNLPNEILQHIFTHLSGRGVVKCRRVSRRWRDNVDALNDSAWRAYCEGEFYNAREEFNKTQLTWRQLYKSLSLWSKVKHAKVTVQHFCEVPLYTMFESYMSSYRHFIVQNNLIGMPEANPNSDTYEALKTARAANSIAYYNVDTLKEDNRVVFDINFLFSKENEYFYVLASSPILPHDPVFWYKYHEHALTVYLVPKRNMSLHMVGTTKYSDKYVQQITLLDDGVCFKNENKLIVVARMRGDDVKIETSARPLKDFVVSCCRSDEDLYMLSQSRNIYALVGAEYNQMGTLDVNTFEEMLHALTKYGFKWNSPNVIRWLCNQTDEYSQRQLLDNPSGKMFIMQVKKNVLTFFYDLHKLDGKIVNFDGTTKYSKETRAAGSIYLDTVDGFPVAHDHVQHLHTVCREDGHRLFVMMESRICVLDLNYEMHEKCSVSVPKTDKLVAAGNENNKDLEETKTDECDSKKESNSLTKRIIQNVTERVNRWRLDVEPDGERWKLQCKEFLNAQEEFDKANLTWEQLHKSLTMWHSVQNAEVTGHELCKTKCTNFTVRNGTIGVPILNTNKPCNDKTKALLVRHKELCNTIVYYDIETLTELRREEFDMYFFKYEERNDFIALVCPSFNLPFVAPHLYLILKPDRKLIPLGEMSFVPRYQMSVADHVICFENKHYQVVVVRGRDGAVVGRSGFLNYISTFGYQNNKPYVLTSDGTIHEISENDQFEIKEKMYGRFNLNTTINAMVTLNKYGFKWYTPSITGWLKQDIKKLWSLMEEPCTASAGMVISGSSTRTLSFYDNLYNSDGSFTMFEDDDPSVMLPQPTPVLTLSLDRLHEFSADTRVVQLEAVSTQTGQRVVVLTSESAYVVDLRLPLL